LIRHHHGDDGLERLRSEISAEMAPQSPEHLRPGASVSHYQIHGFLGAGGMGEVYLAQDSTLGRQVALKLLPERFTKDPERIRRFEQEARAASALNHPNIVTIHQIGRVGEAYFIVTEFIEGQTLRSRIGNAPMPLDQALDVGIQAASALGSAHAARIVHRDIKPDNIMLRPDGLVKILDFGLAKLAEPDSFIDNNAPTRDGIKTAEGVLMGTPQYMSPEQARGQQTDARTDIFSLGVVLYEMAAGHPPFSRATMADIIAAILKEEAVPLAEAAANVPPELERIVRKAMAKDLHERYSAVKDLEVDLKKLRQDLDLNVRFAASSKTMSRRQAIWLGGGVAAAAVSGFAAWQLWPHDARIRSIAVLPFANAAKDEDADWLSRGIGESLVHQIQQLPSLRVTAYSVVLNFKDKAVDPREAGRLLGVPAVVTGTIMLRNNQVKVSAELVEVATGASLWSNTYERSAADILSIEDEIAHAIVNEGIKLKLNIEEQRALGRHPTDNPEAYELYQRGVREYELETEEGYLKARELLKEAIRRDEKFALAYVALASTYSSGAVDGYEVPREAWRQQKELLQKAADLDPTLPGIHFESGSRASAFEWDWMGADREFALAVKSERQELIEPRFFVPYAMERWALGHPEEALQLTRRARRIDPISGYLAVREAHFLRWSGQTAAAIDLYRKIIREDPAEDRAYPGLSDALAAQGAFDDALAIHRQWLQATSNVFYRDRLGGLLSSARGAAGYRQLERAMARIDLDELTERAANGDYVSPLDMSRTYARLDDKDQAFHYLDAAFGERSPGLVYLNADPAWDAIRNDRRFRAAAENVGLPAR
jgi:serine/threonine-protein kinase